MRDGPWPRYVTVVLFCVAAVRCHMDADYYAAASEEDFDDDVTERLAQILREQSRLAELKKLRRLYDALTSDRLTKLLTKPADPPFTFEIPKQVKTLGDPNPFAVSPFDPRFYISAPYLSSVDYDPGIAQSDVGAFQSNDVGVLENEPTLGREHVSNLSPSNVQYDSLVDEVIENELKSPNQQSQTQEDVRKSIRKDLVDNGKLMKSLRNGDLLQAKEDGYYHAGYYHAGDGVKKLKIMPAEVNVQSEREAAAMYMIAIISGISAAGTVGLILILAAYYNLQKSSKAASDVEYPAYGVTGPNKDVSPSGDRRLAQSAQMYHYQHQKQQIIAMERASAERNGSISEVESDDDNEEGDYTVYECPGLATTGEMEVKNPLFHDDTANDTANDTPNVNVPELPHDNSTSSDTLVLK